MNILNSMSINNVYSKSVAYSFSKDKFEDVWTKEWRRFWSQVVSWWVQWQHSVFAVTEIAALPDLGVGHPSLNKHWHKTRICWCSHILPQKSNTYGSKFQDHVMHNYALLQPCWAQVRWHFAIGCLSFDLFISSVLSFGSRIPLPKVISDYTIQPSG